MLKRLSLSAVAAVAVLATAAFTPAFAGHGGHGGGHGGGFRGGHFGNHGHYGHARNFGHRFAHLHHHPHRWHWHWRYGSYGWRPGTVYYGGGDTGGTYGVATPVSSCPSNCLSKEYLPNGGVVFTDRCTNESAVSQPEGPANLK